VARSLSDPLIEDPLWSIAAARSREATRGTDSLLPAEPEADEGLVVEIEPGEPLPGGELEGVGENAAIASRFAADGLIVIRRAGTAGWKRHSGTPGQSLSTSLVMS
jgi:hypothetical protein